MAHADRRVAEARKFGLKRVVHPGERVSTLRQALAVLNGSTEEGSVGGGANAAQAA